VHYFYYICFNDFTTSFQVPTFLSYKNVIMLSLTTTIYLVRTLAKGSLSTSYFQSRVGEMANHFPLAIRSTICTTNR